MFDTGSTDTWTASVNTKIKLAETPSNANFFNETNSIDFKVLEFTDELPAIFKTSFGGGFVNGYFASDVCALGDPSEDQITVE